MKTITTSIFVPAKAKKEMNVLELTEMSYKVKNRAVAISDNLGTGVLDDLQADEEFTLVVNGECHKHEIKMKVLQKTSGKSRLMVMEPDLPEVRRLLEWRIDTSKIMSSNKGQKLQLKNFNTDDLRRLIRTVYANQERHLVNYR
jgi:hypothetical protein